MYNQVPTDAEQLAQMRYRALLQRRTAPPFCSPVAILVLVMALGMVFIGLTMTTIAHWPGSTTMGVTENPLKIAGPILLALGGLLCVVGLGLHCCMKKREQKRFVKSVNNLAQSRITLNQSSSSLPGSKGTKSAPKNNASFAGGQAEGGFPPPPAPHTAEFSDSQHYTSSTYTEEFSETGKKKMGLMQHPQNSVESYGATANRDPNGSSYGNAFDEGDIPVPIREQKKKKNLNSSSENLRSPETEELLCKTQAPQVSRLDYSQSDEDVFNLSTEGDANIPAAVRKKKKKGTKSSRENLNVGEADELLNNTRDYRRGSQTDGANNRSAGSKQYQMTYDDELASAAVSKPTTAPPPPPTKPKPNVGPKPAKPTVVSQQLQQQPSPGEARRLRVHVRAQPGASVSIRRGSATPPHGAAANMSMNSETDL